MRALALSFPHRHLFIIIFVLSQLISFGLYANSLTGQFVMDDFFFLSRPELRDPRHLPQLMLEPVLPRHPQSGLYRPLSMFTFSLTRILFSSTPLPFHLTNVILNGIATFLVFALI